MSVDATAEAEAPERHASWLELFFDLVVVAAVAQLAHLLHGDFGLATVGLFVTLYYAVWSVWTAFTLYANVAGERTRTRAMLFAMFGIAVMAAAVPEATGDRGAIFAAAYCICRLLGVNSWRRTGTVLTSWPAAQAGAAFLPWMISIWVDPPGRYILWVTGIVAEIVTSIIGSRRPDRLLEDARQRSERENLARAARIARGGRAGEAVASPVAASLHGHHLGERLGLFLIIVLGEAVLQVVTAAGEVEWTGGLWFAALAGFGLLVSLWWLTFSYGPTSVPTMGHDLQPALAMPAHFTMTVAITATAAGLGAIAEHPEGHLPAASRWILCGGVALYFLTIAITGIVTGAPRRWLLGWAVPAVLLPLVLGVAGGSIPAWALAAGVLVAAAWQIAYPRLTRTAAAAAQA